jgi:hypothetical protein
MVPFQCVDKVRGAWVIGPACSLDDQQRSWLRSLKNVTRAEGKHLGITDEVRLAPL